MKSVSLIIKVVTALAAVIGAVYIVATYGERIVEWAKNLLGMKKTEPTEAPAEETAPAAEEVPAEQTPADEASEEAPAAEETPAEGPAPAEAPVIDENAPVADESDFEG